MTMCTNKSELQATQKRNEKLSRGHDQKAKNFKTLHGLQKFISHMRCTSTTTGRYLNAHASTKNHFIARTVRKNKINLWWSY